MNFWLNPLHKQFWQQLITLAVLNTTHCKADLMTPHTSSYDYNSLYKQFWLTHCTSGSDWQFIVQGCLVIYNSLCNHLWLNLFIATTFTHVNLLASRLYSLLSVRTTRGWLCSEQALSLLRYLFSTSYELLTALNAVH